MNSLDLQKQQRDIDGTTYEVTPLPTSIGLKALVRLLHIMSPVLAAAAKDGSNQDKVGGMLAALPTALSEGDLEYFTSIFGAQSKYQDGPNWIPLLKQNQELHFAGKYGELFRWLVFCVEVNYKNFFVGITSGGGGVDGLLSTLTAA